MEAAVCVRDVGVSPYATTPEHDVLEQRHRTSTDVDVGSCRYGPRVMDSGRPGDGCRTGAGVDVRVCVGAGGNSDRECEWDHDREWENDRDRDHDRDCVCDAVRDRVVDGDFVSDALTVMTIVAEGVADACDGDSDGDWLGAASLRLLLAL